MTDTKQIRDKDGTRIIDGIKITDNTDNIDEKNALVVTAQLHGRAGGAQSLPIRGTGDAATTTNIDGSFGLNVLASLYARQGEALVGPVKLDDDDGNIATGQKTLLVINLNYVYDATNGHWVPMTQPS